MVTEQEIIKIRNKTNEILAELKYLSQSLKELQKAKGKLEQFWKDAIEAREIITTVAKNTQKLIENKFSSLVTLALQSVFQDDREFLIEFVEKRNKSEVNCYVVKDGNKEEVWPPQGGGGQVNIISLGCRIAFWNLEKTRRPIFFLDEPFAWLHSPEYQERASEMLQMLSNKLNIQFIVISDQEDILADKKFEVINGVVYEK